MNPTCELCENNSTPAHENEYLHGDRLIARANLCDTCAERDDILETLNEQRSHWI